MSSRRLLFLLLLLRVGDREALAQERPVINALGVVNAASFAGGTQFAGRLVPGQIASLFGQNLAQTPQTAAELPLPLTLQGTSVLVGGVAAPLFYVSPSQINFQVPGNLAPGSAGLAVVVQTTAGASDPASVSITYDQAGIFTQDSGGCGQGSVLNVAADGGVTINTQTNSAEPGQFISLFGTGFGLVYFRPEDGYPAPSDPLTYLATGGQAYLGFDSSLQPIVEQTFIGLAPGFVGVNQMNVRIPTDSPEGCSVPLRVRAATGVASQPVLFSIHRGGGQCQDPETKTYGAFLWQKSITTGPQEGAREELDTFEGSLTAAPESLVVFPPAQSAKPGCSCAGKSLPGPRCLRAEPTLLSGGTLILGTNAGAIHVPATAPWAPEYSSTLPAGTVDAGTFAIAGSGGTDVGAFTDSLTVPAPIQITTPLSPGTVIPLDKTFTVQWVDGKPDQTVRVRVRSNSVFGNECECVAAGSDGRVDLGLISVGYGSVFPVVPAPDEVVVTVEPAALRLIPVPGLSLGATHSWKYTFRFEGLN
jgi:uncharacterized protein (TIGR03437 family)